MLNGQGRGRGRGLLAPRALFDVNNHQRAAFPQPPHVYQGPHRMQYTQNFNRMRGPPSPLRPAIPHYPPPQGPIFQG